MNVRQAGFDDKLPFFRMHWLQRMRHDFDTRKTNPLRQTLFRIKICGITNVRDAVNAARCGADAVGLNFFPDSPRYVRPETAREISEALPPSIHRVGVFVNAPPDFIREIARKAFLTSIQLHGDEEPDIVASLYPMPVIRAFRLQPGDRAIVRTYVAACRDRGALSGVLIDAAVPGQLGGTGVQADWHQVADLRSQLVDVPLILAGGLTPSNVAAAITATRADAVDTASGVENAPGQKDHDLVGGFVQTALAAYDAMA